MALQQTALHTDIRYTCILAHNLIADIPKTRDCSTFWITLLMFRILDCAKRDPNKILQFSVYAAFQVQLNLGQNIENLAETNLKNCGGLHSRQQPGEMQEAAPALPSKHFRTFAS